VLRVNQLGYLPAGRKVAVACATVPVRVDHFRVLDARGRSMLGALPAEPAGSFGPCVEVYRLDFSALTAEGACTGSGAPGKSFPPSRR
jgi:hypothetical protein